MIELIMLYFLCKGLGNILREKNRAPLVFQVLMVVFWFTGEFLGAVVGMIVVVIMAGEPVEGFSALAYFMAVLGAVAGAGFWFLIAYLLPDVGGPGSQAKKLRPRSREDEILNSYLK